MKFLLPKRRKWLIAALLLVAAFVAWRFETLRKPGALPCKPGSETIRDDAGKVVEIKRTVCPG
jgi:hypothetical protein